MRVQTVKQNSRLLSARWWLVAALVAAPAAWAHNLDQRDTQIAFEPDFVTLMSQRATLQPTLPLVRAGDEFWVLVKSTPGPGTPTGVGGYLTFYPPVGTQIMGAEYITPDPANPGRFNPIPIKAQSIFPIGSGPIGPASTPGLVGMSLTNSLGQGETLVTAAGVHRGTMAGVYADTGIFYSTDPDTAIFTWETGDRKSYPIYLTNNRGETIKPVTRWDGEQLIGYGLSSPHAPAVDPNGRGSTPWGLGNAVAGPQSGYAWEFSLDQWVADAKPGYSAALIKNAVTNVGPWKRIQYPGSQYAKDQAGLVSAALGYAGVDASTVGYALSTNTPLPATTNLTDQASTKALRISYGFLEIGRPEYARIRVKILEPVAAQCFEMWTDAFGGDAGGENGGKDHEWRYYDPTLVNLKPCTFLQKVVSDPQVKPGDTFSFTITFANNGTVVLTNVTITDTLPAGLTFLSAVPPQLSGPNPLVWNLGTVGTNSITNLTIYAKAASAGTFFNEVVAKAGTNRISTATESVEVNTKSLLRSDKDVTPSTASPGQTVQYTITVYNDGTGVNGLPLVVRDYLPPGFTYASYVGAELNGAPLPNSFVAVNVSNPTQPVFTVTQAIQPEKTLVLRFNALVGASVVPGTYYDSVSLLYEGKVIGGGPDAPVTVGGAKIGDTIFLDWDGDGIQDTGEEGMSNVTVTLYRDADNNGSYETLVGTKTTDANGNYLFTGLQAGNYQVSVPAPGSGGVPSAYTLTADPDGAPATATYNKTLVADEQFLGADWGYQPAGTGTIGDFVFEDLDKDGVWDSGEPGIQNVTVSLYEDTNGNGVKDTEDVLVATQVSDDGAPNPTGFYQFTGLDTARSYLVDVDGSDADIATFFTTKYGASAYLGTSTDPRPVASGFTAVTTADFGFWRNAPASVGDQIYHDVNGSGTYDGGDFPLASITVRLYASDGTTLLATTNSGLDGTYSFPGLLPGTYVVKVDTTDPDIPSYLAASISEYTGVALTAGQTDNTRDFPFINPGTITKQVDKTQMSTPGTLTFTLTPHVAGNSALVNATVQDPLPPGTTFNSAGQGGQNDPPGTVTWTLGSTTAKSDGTTTISGTTVTQNTITHVSPNGDTSNSTGSGGGTSLGLSVPSGTAAGDVMIAALSWDGGNGTTITAPGGWTQIGTTREASAGGISTITFVSSSAMGSLRPGTTVVVTKPASIQANDVLIASVAWDGGTGKTISPPSAEWILIGVRRDSGTALGSVAYYKVAGGSEPASYTWTVTVGTSAKFSVGISAYRGVDTANPINAQNSQVNASSTSITAPSITPTVANTKLVGIFATEDGAITASPFHTVTPPGTMTERFDVNTYDSYGPPLDPHTGGGNEAGNESADENGPAANTPTGTRVATTTDGINIGRLLALKPADATTKLGQAAYYRVATGSEPGSYSWTISPSAKASGGISSYRGVDTSAPINDQAAQANNTASTSATAPSITPPDDNTMLVGIFASQNAAGSTAPPGTMTEAYDASSGGTPAAGIESAFESYAPANTATGNRVATLTASTISIGQLIALKHGTTSSPWSYDVTTSLSANRSLVVSSAAGDEVVVTMTLTATTKTGSPPFPISVTPGALSATFSGGGGGGGATFGAASSSPVSLASGVPQAVTYTSTSLTPGASAGGVLTFKATPSDPNGTWAQGTANTTLITPPLTLTVNVPNPHTHNVVTNTGKIYNNGVLMSESLPTHTTLDASLGDYVWNDANGDGLQAGESGIGGVRVYLDANNNGQYDVGEAYATTDASGYYHLYGLAADTYNVRYDYSTVPSGYVPTTTNRISYALGATEQYTGADFGLRSPAQIGSLGSIGDTLWFDLNNNGVVDTGEGGISNVTVNLYWDTDGSGTVTAGDFLYATTASSANGTYTFSDLPAGRYVVDVDEADADFPAGGLALVTGGSPVTSPPASNVWAVNLGASENFTTADFGYNWTGSIGDFVWWDVDADGVQDGGGEVGFSNAVVLLYYDSNGNGFIDLADAHAGTAYTDGNGGYTFTNLPPGGYFVIVDTQTLTTPGATGDWFSWVPTTPVDSGGNGGVIVNATLGAGQHRTDVDFGFVQRAIVGNRVFFDANHNGLEDPGETGLSNVVVTLTGFDTNGAPVSMVTTTDPTGHYEFLVPGGSYTVSVDTNGVPSYLPQPTTPLSYGIVVENGDEIDTLDFGFDHAGRVGDFIFVDANSNGVWNAGEPGLEGVVVLLYDSASNLLESAITDTNGQYLFTGLADGTYLVQVFTNSLPAGYYGIPTVDPTGAKDNWGTATVSGGGSDLTMDFGYPPVVVTYTVSGTVWNDANTNATINGGEAGFSNVTLNVYIDTNNDGTNDQVFVVQTDANGAYSVAGIPSNSTVRIAVSEGTLPSTAYQITPTMTNVLTVAIISANAANQNFGYFLNYGSIAGTVVDGNGNGVSGDPSDTPLTNVTVTLYYAGPDGIFGTDDDAAPQTARTAADGSYSFSNLVQGLYRVVETDPLGYRSLADVDGGNPNVVDVTLARGQNVTGRDFEDTPAAAIRDRVWLDEDGNGIQDVGEEGIANVRIELVDSNGVVVASTVTDLDGRYAFEGVDRGTYTMRVVTATMPAGLATNQTYDPDTTTNSQTTVTIAAGQSVPSSGFGYNWASVTETDGGTGTGAIGNRVWIDSDGDGREDLQEAGFGGLTVVLKTAGVDGEFGTADDVTNAVTTTDGAGFYIFDGLMPNAYVVEVNGGTAPSGYTQTGDPDQFGRTATGGDSRTTTPIVLGPGDVIVDVDFGYQPTAALNSISSSVYLDADGTGPLTTSGRGLAGVSVVLVKDLNGNGVWDTNELVVASRVTGANGAYAFDRLPDGDYVVAVTDTEGLLGGLDLTAWPGAVPGRAFGLSMAANHAAAPQGFGFAPPRHAQNTGLIGDTIFLDRNGSGAADAGEGIEGVTVELFDDTGTNRLAVAVTDAEGHYEFGGLYRNNATYFVKVVTNTLPNAGAGLTNSVDPDGGTGSVAQVTLTPTAPTSLTQDFGYTAVTNNTISGTLWEDLDADGNLAASETSRFASVEVVLRDTNGNAVARLATDASGNYAFTNVPSGTYLVEVLDGLAGSSLNNYWHSLGDQYVGSNNTSKAQAYTVSVSGGQTVDTVDFGYYIKGAGLGNRVWWDANDNGIQDEPEENNPGISNVLVTLVVTYPSGTSITLRTRTDGNGYYSFGNLLLDEDYTGVGVGQPTFSISAQAPPTGGQAPVGQGGDPKYDSNDPAGTAAATTKGTTDMSGQATPGAETLAASYDFGFDPQPTVVVVSGFRAFTRSGGVVVQWETAFELGTIGFYLERWSGGAWVRVNPTLLPAHFFSPPPNVYEIADLGAQSGGTYTWRVIEMDTHGRANDYGPYTVTVDGAGITYEAWAADRFGDAGNPAASRGADPDADGLTNFEEYLAGTSPLDANSRLKTTSFEAAGPGEVVVRWSSEAGRSYALEISTDLNRGFLPLAGLIPATPPVNVHTVRVDAASSALYLRVIVR